MSVACHTYFAGCGVCVEIRIICASWFFPSVMWVLEMELGELGLAASTATTH